MGSVVHPRGAQERFEIVLDPHLGILQENVSIPGKRKKKRTKETFFSPPLLASLRAKKIPLKKKKNTQKQRIKTSHLTKARFTLPEEAQRKPSALSLKFPPWASRHENRIETLPLQRVFGDEKGERAGGVGREGAHLHTSESWGRDEAPWRRGVYLRTSR